MNFSTCGLFCRREEDPRLVGELPIYDRCFRYVFRSKAKHSKLYCEVIWIISRKSQIICGSKSRERETIAITDIIYFHVITCSIHPSQLSFTCYPCDLLRIPSILVNFESLHDSFVTHRYRIRVNDFWILLCNQLVVHKHELDVHLLLCSRVSYRMRINALLVLVIL